DLETFPTSVLLTNVFFFQAEDGIRDGHVTGVQTCALPISEPHQIPYGATRHAAANPREEVDGEGCSHERVGDQTAPQDAGGPERSEERRVGKECSIGRSAEE